MVVTTTLENVQKPLEVDSSKGVSTTNTTFTIPLEQEATNDDRSTKKIKPLDLKRKQTDVLFLVWFVSFFISWICAVVYVVSTRRVHEVSRIAKPTATTITDLQALSIWLSSLAVFALTIAGIYILHSKKLFCAASSVRIVEIVLLALSTCDATADRLMIHEIVAIYVIAAFFICFNNLNYYYSYDKYCKRFLAIPGTSKSLLCATGLVFFFIFLTVAAVQFTAPTDYLRYFIMFGCVYVLDFVMNFAKMVFALVVASYQQASRSEDVADSHILQYVKPVARHHLGSIAFSTFAILSSCQASLTILRRGSTRAKLRRSLFHEFCYRVYLMVDLASLAAITTAKSGRDHRAAMTSCCAVLIEHCSSSRNSLNRVLDIATKLTLRIGFLVNFVLLPAKVGCDVTILEWIGYGIILGIVHLHSAIKALYRTRESATRLFILQERVAGRSSEEIDLDADAYNLCFDLCYCEERRIEDEARSGDRTVPEGTLEVVQAT